MYKNVVLRDFWRNHSIIGVFSLPRHTVGFLYGICGREKNNSTTDSEQQHCGMTAYKKGFTLIELLVVVLIIGILSAVALPQYRLAVAKARAAEAVVVLGALEKAWDIYYMANNALPMSLEDLDVSIPSSSHFRYSLLRERLAAQGVVYLEWYPSGQESDKYCAVGKDSGYQQVCLSLGYTQPHNLEGSLVYYKLPDTSV